MVLVRAGISRTRPAMPAARGEESERARERCPCIYNKVKSYWGPTNEWTVTIYGVVICNTTIRYAYNLVCRNICLIYQVHRCCVNDGFHKKLLKCQYDFFDSNFVSGLLESKIRTFVFVLAQNYVIIVLVTTSAVAWRISVRRCSLWTRFIYHLLTLDCLVRN